MTKNNVLSSILVCLILLVSLFVLTIYYFIYLDSYPTKTAIIEIPKGTSLKGIASILEGKELIRSKPLFLAAVFLTGSKNSLKAGEYEIVKDSSLEQIMNMFVSGQVLLRKVTIPEGKNIYEISGILKEANITDSEEFIGLTTDGYYVSSLLGTNADSLEGYLYPDTYFFPKNADADNVIKIMAERFKTVYKELKQSDKKNLSDHEIVILASMIEKETGINSERKLISAVFYNRLNKGMRLECDPTVIYGLGTGFNGNITKKDLSEATPYNTYKINGLPAGPIANPGKESISAALNPSEVDYLFFVSKGDGTHVFSSNYRNHINAVNKYIKKK
ncbi:MAG: endolytic transglycosylase MltG [Thermodesulfobacteriota bacterium]